MNSKYQIPTIRQISSMRLFRKANDWTIVRKNSKYILAFFVGSLIAVVSHMAKAQVLFEGYSKVLSGGVPIGYSITKYEFDSKKKQFVATTFLKTNQLGGNLTESLKAYSSEDMKPLSYQFTTMEGPTVKTIDAKFEKDKMIAVIDGVKKETISKDIPKGAFLSSFLAYVMLRSPQGFKADTKYEFQAIAEEDAALQSGIAYVKSPEDFNGLKVLRVFNEFKGAKFISQVTEKGEVITTKAPAVSISTELVASPSDATMNFPVPTATLKTLFGEVPMGQVNPVSELKKNSPPPGKQQGIPGGKGIFVKPGGK